MPGLHKLRDHWTEAFEDVKDEIWTLFFTRQMWRVLRAALLDGGTKNRASVLAYLDRTYIASEVLAIRRQLDMDKQSNSLARSLQQLVNQPRLMDRARFVEMHDAAVDDPYWNANAAFDHYSSPSSDTVSRKLVDDAIEKLRKAAEPVTTYADKAVAHNDRKRIEILYGDIDKALDTLESTVKQFWGLVHPGQELGTATPVMDLSFLHIFRAPLISERFVPPVEH